MRAGMEVMRVEALKVYSVSQWALLFFLCSLAGWCWEVALYAVRERRFVNRGFLSGPLLPIYGFGAVGILLVCLPVRGSVLRVALRGMLAASALEYATGAAMEALFHVRYWDYSDQPLNLNGHISLLAALTWAAFSVLLVRIVHPLVHPLLSRAAPLLSCVAATAMGVFALLDASSSVRRALELRALLTAQGDIGGEDRRVQRVRRMLRRNPGAVSRRHGEALERMKTVTHARGRRA